MVDEECFHYVLDDFTNLGMSNSARSTRMLITSIIYRPCVQMLSQERASSSSQRSLSKHWVSLSDVGLLSYLCLKYFTAPLTQRRSLIPTTVLPTIFATERVEIRLGGNLPSRSASTGCTWIYQSPRIAYHDIPRHALCSLNVGMGAINVQA